MAIEVETSGLRSGTTAEWAATTLILGDGELGLDKTTKEVKVGDGTNLWASLASEGGDRRGRVTLVAGTATVALTSVTATTVILLTAQVLGTVTVAKPLAVTARTASTSFVVTSADATDTSVVGWLAVEV